MYSIEFKPRASKFIEAQPAKIQRQLLAHIDPLASNPRPSGCKLLYADEKLYRIRCGDYRIIFQIKDKILLVVVVRVAHRKDIYRNL
jgi:mRNA interferase RelE/StbE